MGTIPLSLPTHLSLLYTSSLSSSCSSSFPPYSPLSLLLFTLLLSPSLLTSLSLLFTLLLSPSLFPPLSPLLQPLFSASVFLSSTPHFLSVKLLLLHNFHKTASVCPPTAFAIFCGYSVVIVLISLSFPMFSARSVGDAMCTIAACTSFPEPFITPPGFKRLPFSHKRFAGHRASDHLAMLNAFYQWERTRSTKNFRKTFFSFRTFFFTNVFCHTSWFYLIHNFVCSLVHS